MIVVMQTGVAQTQIDHVVQLVRDAGLREHVIVGTERTVIAVVGDERKLELGALENAGGVDRVMPVLAPYKVASREVKREPSVIPLGNGTAVGGKRIGLIAGPCSVESRQQLIEIAHAVKEAGAIGLRGGAFKPRTNPYQFQGLGEKGLEMLAEAREATGLAIVTEVMGVDQVELVSRYADVLQIGTRNMHNFNLLVACGQTKRSVLLKRGWSATLDEFLLAAEYILNAGNPNVILCERGIRTHETYVRNTLPLAIIPAVKRESHLPILIDPSQGTGHAYMVPAMCRASIAAGADGLIVEVHADPEHALTDGAQSITPEVFAQTVRECARIAEAVGRTA
ncbi:MAG: 3-deoxy-7-phosphoheptulonate synthase [Phycisphaerae bacterium]|nr:3-deoxy-7-phosphoheptulonate synthase [Phycisphaerae bacterium]